MIFKAGDKVKVCFDSGTYLVRGKTYSVRRADGRYVYLADVYGGWLHDHFDLVTAAPTARANDPATSKGKRKVNKYEQAVLSCLASGPKTGKEMVSISGFPLNCITPRFAPLRRKGLIKALEVPVEWGENRLVPRYVKRDKQIVWVLA